MYVLVRLKKKDSSHNMVIVASTDFTSIKRAVYNVLTEVAVLAEATLTLSSVVLAALSTGSIWTADTTGFNFIDPILTTDFPSGSSIVRVEYEFIMTSGEVYHLRVEGPVVARMAG